MLVLVAESNLAFWWLVRRLGYCTTYIATEPAWRMIKSSEHGYEICSCTSASITLFFVICVDVLGTSIDSDIDPSWHWLCYIAPGFITLSPSLATSIHIMLSSPPMAVYKWWWNQDLPMRSQQGNSHAFPCLLLTFWFTIMAKPTETDEWQWHETSVRHTTI